MPGRIFSTTPQNAAGSIDVSGRPASDANTSTRFSPAERERGGPPPSCARTTAGSEIVKPSGTANVYGAPASDVTGALVSAARGAAESSTVEVRLRQARSSPAIAAGPAPVHVATTTHEPTAAPR